MPFIGHSLEFCEIVAQGAVGKVWSGKADGMAKAIKEIRLPLAAKLS